MVNDGAGGWRASELGFRFLNELQGRFLTTAPGDGNGAAGQL
jgi:hypothetical protein